MTRQLVASIVLLIASSACAQTHRTSSGEEAVRHAIVGDALLTEGAYHALAEISDRFGPRMVGTPGHVQSMDWVENALATLGIETRRETFSFPGWRRGEDAVRVLEPFDRPLRAAALGYSAPTEPMDAELVLYVRGDASPEVQASYRGRVLLIPSNVRLTAGEQRQLVEDDGARGFLLINRVAGGQLLARTANLTGEPAPVPMFVLTQEEGRWLRRQLDDGETVRVRLEVASQSMPMTGMNLVATLPGTSGETIVVGAHFDSWDLGQGAMDNGLGVAQLLEAARLLRAHARQHTIELVWFDAEEIGLWGSRAYAERHVPRNGDTDVRVMLNLDMVGTPIGINAMGFDALVPVLTEATDALGSWRFTQPLANKPWLGSDHHPFIERGVPAITFNAPIDPDAVRYYHDFADTIDKVDRYELARASAIVALVTHVLANDTRNDLRRLSPSETTALFQTAGVEASLRGIGWWPASPIWPGARVSE
ncbi:MAG: M28 family metallopeptidase [Rubricoccaceae bacterium]